MLAIVQPTSAPLAVPGLSPATRPTFRGSEIAIDRVSRRFGDVVALDDISLTVAPGEFVTLLGPSGSGKTTLLGTVAGFQPVSAGSIRVDGRPIQDVPPHKRGFGMVFQSYALFPHMTVAQNVAFPLRMARMGRADAEARVRQTLELMKLGALAGRLPSELSGGQQQRVAIARAIVRRPNVVLMDEPLSALDRRLRETIQIEIRDLHRTIGTTILFVTHDQGEALALSDRIAVLDAGRIVQVGTPGALYHRPTNRFVAGFVGESNLLDATVLRTADGIATVQAADARFDAGYGHPLHPGERVTVLLRPERVVLGPPGGALATATVTGTVNLGEVRRMDLRLPSGAAIQARRLDGPVPAPMPGDTVGLSWTQADAWVLG